MSIRIEKDSTFHCLRFIVAVMPRGHRCGYVGIPKDHPLYGVDYSQPHPSLRRGALDGQPIGERGLIPLLCMDPNAEDARPDCYFDVHGGLTYSGGKDYPVNTDGSLWWFGFDCAHCDDDVDPDLMDEPNRKYYDEHPSFRLGGAIRDLFYVETQCQHLAAQLAAITRP